MIYAEIEKEFTFLSAIHLDNKFLINHYDMKANMEVYTEDPKEQNIAMERMTYFLSAHIENSVFVEDTETDAIEKYKAAGLTVCAIPDEPYDQIIGMILINKCNAIMEGRIHLYEITFGSRLSNYIKFKIEEDLAKEEFKGKFWYNNSSLTLMDKLNSKDKVIPLFHKNDWEELALTWK